MLTSWECAHGGFCESDEKLSYNLLEEMDSFPSYDELCGSDKSLTSGDMLSVKAEHGLWYAVEFERIDEDGDSMLCEVGVVVDWRSDAHPFSGYNPCYVAELLYAEPSKQSRWNTDVITEATTIYLPIVDPDTGKLRNEEEVAREAYDLLSSTLENIVF